MNSVRSIFHVEDLLFKDMLPCPMQNIDIMEKEEPGLRNVLIGQLKVPQQPFGR